MRSLSSAIARAAALSAAAFLPLFLGASCQSGGKTEGQKSTDALTKSIGRFQEAVQDYQKHLGTAIAEHDAIVQNKDGDLPGHYKKFSKGIKDCDETAQEIGELVAGIKSTAEPYFTKWQQDLQAIADEDLRERSADRMKAAQERVQGLLKHGAKVQEAVAPLIQTLRDHATYLSNDLNVESAASLSKDSKKLKEAGDDAKKVFDSAVAAAKELGQSIAMRTEPTPAASSK